MNEKQKIAILILAAGNSSRMGERIKQLLPWKTTTLLGNAINQANASEASVTCVVIGAFEVAIKANVALHNVETIKNENWENGLGSSIAAGIRFFSTQSLDYDAVLVMLADQPLIDTNYLNTMIETWITYPSNVITTQYKNRSGVPAIFGKDYFDKLRNLNKDFGAKDIISAHKELIIEIDSGGKQIDVDNWETYQKLITVNN